MSANRKPHKERTLQKIREAKILERLLKHYAGKLDPPLDQGQINIGLRLMNKLIPDLKATEQTIIDNRIQTRDEIMLELEGLGFNSEEVWKTVRQH